MTPWTLSCQVPLSTGFSRQEYWSRLPCLLPIKDPCLYVSWIARWFLYQWDSPAAQLVKNVPTTRETRVRSLNPWRRERLPTPVFWSGEFHGLYSPWGHKELDMTERLSPHFRANKERIHLWFSKVLFLLWWSWGFPGGRVLENLPAIAGDRHWFDLWVGKIPWSRAWQPTPVFWPGEVHGVVQSRT